jgi:hypothetical protein
MAAFIEFIQHNTNTPVVLNANTIKKIEPRKGTYDDPKIKTFIWDGKMGYMLYEDYYAFLSRLQKITEFAPIEDTL